MAYVISLTPLIHSCIIPITERYWYLYVGVWVNGEIEQIHLPAPHLLMKLPHTARVSFGGVSGTTPIF
jgi:hypothetical protein